MQISLAQVPAADRLYVARFIIEGALSGWIAYPDIRTPLSELHVPFWVIEAVENTVEQLHELRSESNNLPAPLRAQKIRDCQQDFYIKIRPILEEADLTTKPGTTA